MLDRCDCFAASIAVMKYKDDTDEREMLEWEKVNAIEHVRKDSIFDREQLESRVIVIEDRYLRTFFLRYVVLLH